MTTRRDFLTQAAGTAAVFVAGACSTSTASQPKPAAPAAPAAATTAPAAAAKPAGPLKTVRLAVQGPFLPLAAPFIAKRKNYFAEFGVDVPELKIVPAGSQALVAGEIDFFCAGASDVMFLAEKGENAIAVVGLVKGIQLHLEVHPDVARERGVTPSDPLDKRLAALKGMTVSVTAPASAPDAVLDFMIRQARLQPSDVTKRFINTQPAQLAALEQRQIDAIVGGPPLSESLVANGQGILLIRGPELQSLADVVYEASFGMKAWVDSHPDEARGVAKALAKATEFMATDPTAAQFLNQGEFSAFPVEILNTSLELLRPALWTDGKVAKSNWDATMAYAKAAGLLSKDVDVNEGTYWTNRYVS